MINNFEKSLELVLKSEGGFTDNPKDPGNHLDDGRQGYTNLGVTQKAWEEFVGHKVSTADMKALTPEKVAPFYQQKYWNPVYGQVLSKGIDYLCLDFAINAGPGRCVKTLQSAIGCVPDGVVGPRTMELIKQADPADLINKFSDAKIRFYEGLPTFPTFGKGWLARVETVRKAALEMLNES